MLNNDFHESTVLEFDFLKNELVIEILSEPDGTLITTLVFTGVEEIVVDGEVSSDSLGMIYPDGEVLSITENSNTVSIYIIWNDFKTQSSLTKSYEFNCQSITMDRRHYDESVS